MKRVAVVMGSDSDLPLMKKAFAVLDELGLLYDAHILSAHRSPKRTLAFAEKASSAGYGVIIAAAGKAAHLAGFIAANTVLPVIGVPVSASMEGLDALLATVQMPSGIPVATVAVDGAANAALLAAEILAVDDPDLSSRLSERRRQMDETAARKNAELERSFTS